MSKILGKGIYIMGEPPVAAGSLAVGSSVYCNVNGVKTEFIVVHQGKPSSLYDDSCNGTWLLMKDCYENRQWHNGSSNKYEGSDIHTYLNSTFLNLFSSNIKDVIKQVKIPYRKNGGYGTNQSSANGLSCKIFLLSGYEVGWTSSDHQYFPQDGAKLSYFESGTGTSANNKRIAYRNGSATNWWLRSPDTDDSSFVWRVSSDGNYGRYDAATSYGVRPALVILSTALIDSEGNITGKTQSLTGTWVFNSALGAWPSSLNNTNLYTTFESNGTTYPTFNFTYGTTTGLYYNSTLAYTLASGGELVTTWANTAYRVITFTTPFKRDTNPDFYDWFVSNAVYAKGWKLNETITAYARTGYPASSSSSSKNIGRDSCAPNFTGLSYTVDDGTTIYTDIYTTAYYYRSRVSGYKKYTYRSVTNMTLRVGSESMSGTETASRTSTSSTSNFPSNPQSANVTTSQQILYFKELPSTIISWLLTNATPV